MAERSIYDIIDDFTFLDDWEDRYRYVIELGRDMPPFPEDQRTDANKVRGCASQVWLHTDLDSSANGPILRFQGDSDAMIVKGLIAILVAQFSGQRAEDIVQTDPSDTFSTIGLTDHLTQQRSNGLASMVQRIKSEAQHALAENTG
ncbi:MAG: SufE family protein [Pseudomonadota bacterium]